MSNTPTTVDSRFLHLATATQRPVLEAIQQHGSMRAAAKALGVNYRTVHNHFEAFSRRLEAHTEVQVTPPPTTEEPIEELIARKKAGMQRSLAHEEWAKLIPVTVNSSGPIGLFLVGDPHIDDDHCDIERLEADLTTVGKTKGMYAGHIGDLTNNWIGRLQALYAAQSTTFNDGLRLTEWMLDLCPNLFVVAGNHDCHDYETEALTRRGWLKPDEILDSDEVLTMNVDTGRAEWNPILARVDKAYSGPMVSIESQAVSALVTPGHRVLHRKRTAAGFTERRYATADSLPHRFALPTCADENLPDLPLSDAQLRLAGWVLTDGSIRGQDGSPRVTLYQSKPTTDIDRILGELELEHTVRVRDRAIVEVCGRALVKAPLPQREYCLTADASRRVLSWVPSKALPAWVRATSRRQFDVLLDALIAGDGTWDGADPSSKTVGVLHGARAFLEEVQAVAVRRGWYARMSMARGKDWRLNLCRRQDLQLERSQTVQTVQYVGRVWCLTVPNGNFMVRRRGAAHFSGNCWNKGMDLLRFVSRQGVLSPHGARMELTWPDGKKLRIHARHDFPGRSQYSDTHGMKRELLFGHRDHVLVAGHTHVDEARAEPSIDGEAHWLFRISGYKVIDSYAKEHHFRPKRFRPGVLLILDPDSPVPADRVKPYWDIEYGADFLTFLRNKRRAR